MSWRILIYIMQSVSLTDRNHKNEAFGFEIQSTKRNMKNLGRAIAYGG
jgi:hypothetical protein